MPRFRLKNKIKKKVRAFPQVSRKPYTYSENSVESRLRRQVDVGASPLFTAPRPGGLSVPVLARPVIGPENDSKPHRFRSRRCHVLLLPVGHLYLRILCASILRFWLLEHTTATRSGWLGIATLRMKVTVNRGQNVVSFEPCIKTERTKPPMLGYVTKRCDYKYCVTDSSSSGAGS